MGLEVGGDGNNNVLPEKSQFSLPTQIIFFACPTKKILPRLYSFSTNHFGLCFENIFPSLHMTMTNLRIDLGHSRAIFADFAKSRNLLLRQLVLFRPKIESTKKKVVKRNRRREIYDRKSKRNESRKHSSSRTEEEVGKLGQTLVFLLDGNGLPNQPSFTIFSLDRNVYYFQGF